MTGHKDMLGIWIGQAESSRFWLTIFNELKARGYSDILIACADGLTGFSDAIESVFPEAEVQLCVIHQISTSIKYIASKHQKEFMADLKPIYAAVAQAKCACASCCGRRQMGPEVSSGDKIVAG